MSWLKDAEKVNRKLLIAEKEMKDNKESEINISGKKINFASHLESMLGYMNRKGLATITIEGVEYTREEIETTIDAYWDRYLREEAKFKEKTKDLPNK